MERVRIKIDENEKFAADYDFSGLGKGGAFSIFMHASIFFLAAFFSHQQLKSEVVLTEITMVDQVIPLPEEAPPPMPVAPPPKDTNVWDFLKQAIPIKAPELSTAQMPLELPKKNAAPELSAMPEALKLGQSKDLNRPSIADQPLDLVGRKAVAPASVNVNPLQMNKKQDSLAMTSSLPSGISLGKKNSFLPSAQAPVMASQDFSRRANLQARGGSLADMPTIKQPEVKKKQEFSTSDLTIKREGNTFKIFGPLKDRALLEKFLPRYPRWAEEQGIECNVSIHFFVLPDGRVKNNLFVEQGSGYSEMDQLAMKALQSFKFAPLGSSARQEEQEGVIVFYFRLSR